MRIIYLIVVIGCSVPFAYGLGVSVGFDDPISCPFNLFIMFELWLGVYSMSNL